MQRLPPQAIYTQAYGHVCAHGCTAHLPRSMAHGFSEMSLGLTCPLARSRPSWPACTCPTCPRGSTGARSCNSSGGLPKNAGTRFAGTATGVPACWLAGTAALARAQLVLPFAHLHHPTGLQAALPLCTERARVGQYMALCRTAGWQLLRALPLGRGARRSANRGALLGSRYRLACHAPRVGGHSCDCSCVCFRLNPLKHALPTGRAQHLQSCVCCLYAAPCRCVGLSLRAAPSGLTCPEASSSARASARCRQMGSAGCRPTSHPLALLPLLRCSRSVLARQARLACQQSSRCLPSSSSRPRRRGPPSTRCLS